MLRKQSPSRVGKTSRTAVQLFRCRIKLVTVRAMPLLVAPPSSQPGCLPLLRAGTSEALSILAGDVSAGCARLLTALPGPESISSRVGPAPVAIINKMTSSNLVRHIRPPAALHRWRAWPVLRSGWRVQSMHQRWYAPKQHKDGCNQLRQKKPSGFAV